MAITIDNKEYDENDLDNNIKNSINQVQNSNQAIAQLQAEILNHQILSNLRLSLCLVMFLIFLAIHKFCTDPSLF